MSEENKAVIRRFIDEGINGQNLAVLDELFDPDFVWHGGFFGETRGLDELKEVVGPFFAAFPDLRTEIDDLVAEGDRVAARFTVTATDHGGFLGAPATGKRVTWGGHPVYRLEGGKIVEEWFFEDHLSLVHQLGLLPAPSAA